MLYPTNNVGGIRKANPEDVVSNRNDPLRATKRGRDHFQPDRPHLIRLKSEDEEVIWEMDLAGYRTHANHKFKAVLDRVGSRPTCRGGVFTFKDAHNSFSLHHPKANSDIGSQKMCPCKFETQVPPSAHVLRRVVA